MGSIVLVCGPLFLEEHLIFFITDMKSLYGKLNYAPSDVRAES